MQGAVANHYGAFSAKFSHNHNLNTFVHHRSLRGVRYARTLLKMNQPNPKSTFRPKRSFSASPQDDLATIIKEEGAKIRKTIWLAAIVIVLLLISAPLLIAGASALLIAIPIGILSAIIGAFIGRLINRRRQQRIFAEIPERNDDNIIPLDTNSEPFGTNKDA
jgi:hypothetical protein